MKRSVTNAALTSTSGAKKRPAAAVQTAEKAAATARTAPLDAEHRRYQPKRSAAAVQTAATTTQANSGTSDSGGGSDLSKERPDSEATHANADAAEQCPGCTDESSETDTERLMASAFISALTEGLESWLQRHSS